MNQILNFNDDYEENKSDNIQELASSTISSNYKINKFLKFQFIFSNLITLTLICYFIIYKINISKQESLSQRLISEFNISTLYDSPNNYSSEKIYYSYNNTRFYIIGIIDIPKLNITYPIISEVSDEFLKIAPCKFYGPEINETR